MLLVQASFVITSYSIHYTKLYDVEALGSNASDWARIETDLENGLFTMTGAASQANAYINLSSIAASVDQGGLEINFTVDAWIGSEAEEELDSASAELHFKATEGGADLVITSYSIHYTKLYE